MKKSIKLTIFILVLTLIQNNAYSWNGKGHRVAAAIAYRQMDEATQENLTELLKAHPDYPKWQKKLPKNFDEGLYLFMRSSTWADEVRANQKDSPYNHPTWHYIDYEIHPDGNHITTSQKDDDYILYGIKKSRKEVLNGGLADSVRAIYISWINHLVGDVHQPMHCGSFVSEVYPTGDRGGNEFWIRPNDEKPVKLHALWDNALGRDWDMPAALNQAILLQSQYPKDSLPELEKTDCEAWCLESHQMSWETAYREGTLKGSQQPEDAPPLPQGYTADMKEVSRRRIVLAGYRLGALLTELINP